MADGPVWVGHVPDTWTYITTFGQVDVYHFHHTSILIVWGNEARWSVTNGTNLNATKFMKSKGLHRDVKDAVRALIRMELSHG